MKYTQGINRFASFDLHAFEEKVQRLACHSERSSFILPEGHYQFTAEELGGRYFYESDWNVIISDGLNLVTIDFTNYAEKTNE